MPSLMAEPIFSELAEARANYRKSLPNPDSLIAPIFVPWIGDHFKQSQNGIYFVGIDLAPESSDVPQIYDERLLATEHFIDHDLSNYEHRPFWRYVGSITQNLLGGRPFQTSNKWGWSNILKIGRSDSLLHQKLIQTEREACVKTLKQGFNYLRNSLILIMSADGFGILSTALESVTWNTEREDETGTWWAKDAATGNLIVHSYHPGFSFRQKFADAALNFTMELARAEQVPIPSH